MHLLPPSARTATHRMRWLLVAGHVLRARLVNSGRRSPAYQNQPLREAVARYGTEHGCPHMYADPTQDPRMQQ